MVTRLQARYLAVTFLEEIFAIGKRHKLGKKSEKFYKAVDSFQNLIYAKCNKNHIDFEKIDKNPTGYILGWLMTPQRITPVIHNSSMWTNMYVNNMVVEHLSSEVFDPGAVMNEGKAKAIKGHIDRQVIGMFKGEI